MGKGYIFTTTQRRFTLVALLLFAFLLAPGVGWGQTQTAPFTANGTFSVPLGVTSIKVECWGGGGGGATVSATIWSTVSGGGGGGGGYAASIVAVKAGDTYSIIVGSGGSAGQNGGNSSFGGNVVVAEGGKGSISSSGGIGGGAASIGSIKYSGGSGGNGVNNSYSGGGGGAAGSSGIGSSANGTTGGSTTSENGGAGVNGVGFSYNLLGNINGGYSGTTNTNSYGGGGSGATSSSKWEQKTGGKGDNGYVVITYTYGAYLTVSQASLDCGFTASGSTSANKTFSIAGYYLAGAPSDITINAPANFEVSLSAASGFSSTITVPYGSATLGSTPIYVRFKPTAPNASYTGNIVVSGGGAAVQNVAVTGNSNITYCASSGTTTTTAGITLVQLNTINNTSAKPSGYSDYTSISTSVVKGNPYNLTVNLNTNGNNKFNSVAWIDWNADGDFADVGETYTLGTATNTANGKTSSSPLSITVPASAVLGNLRMRVSAKKTNPLTSCETGFDGEVEDYTIRVEPVTYYSFKTGDWDQKTTWTSDPGGTTWVDVGTPQNNSRIVILSGRTVTLPADVATTNMSVVINEGGALDLAAKRFANSLASLSGQGTLRIGDSYFPIVTANSFVLAGGGTTEYNYGTAKDLPNQAVYNNLTINTGGAIATQVADIALNGLLHVQSGTMTINNGTARRLKLTVAGDVVVDKDATLGVGTGKTVNSTDTPTTTTNGGIAPFIDYYDMQTHRVVVSGSFTNNGTVKFTNQAYPIYDAFPTNGAATLYFQGASNSSLVCNGVTNLYNLVVDKGIDQSFKLMVSSSDYKNFKLFGANNAAYDVTTPATAANPNIKKALWIRRGALELKGVVAIPSLTEGTTANSEYYIPANGAMLLDGSDVVVLGTADDYAEVNVAYGV